MNSFLHDVRFAVRSLARTPGVTGLAVLTLALGIGANAAIFSVIHGVLIAPLPYPGVDRVAIGFKKNPALGDVSVSPSMNEVERWRQSSSIEAIAVHSDTPVVMTGGDEPESLDGQRVDVSLLAFAGARPRLGRLFTPEDAASEAAARVVMLSEPLWQRRFGGDHGVIGRTVELSDKSYEVVGVLPASFRLPLADVDVLMPLAPPPAAPAGGRAPRLNVSVLVRVKPGVTFAAAQDELTRLGGIESVGNTGQWQASLMDPSALSGPTFQRTLFILLGAVACVLLIACANVAHLILARNAARRREIAVRVALGATTGRLVRQLLTESLLLALAGGAGGIALALWGVDAISALRPPQMRQLADIRISPLVFGFSFLLALATGVLFGLLPALSASRRSSIDALKQGSVSMAGQRGVYVRRALTVAEIALAIVLLSGAGLLLRSYARLVTADLGFKPGGLVAVKLALPSSRYARPAVQEEFAGRYAELLRSHPAVRQVVMASGVPPSGGLIFGQVEIEGRPATERGPSMFGGGFVEPGFFEILGIPLLQGRTFVDGDTRAGEPVVINQRMAAIYWPGEEPVGKRMRLGARNKWSTVVGVVSNLKVTHGDPNGVQIYFPLAGAGGSPEVNLIVATAGDPGAAIGIVKSLAWSLDPKLSMEGISTIEDAVAEIHARPRFNVVLLTVFAALGLTLAAIGTYGVISYSVGLRTREIGLRMALGAAATDIRRGILGEVLLLCAAGTVLGIGGAIAGSRFMTALLFQVSPSDPVTLGGVALVLTLTSVAAAWMPARRAMRVDPMIALRAE